MSSVHSREKSPVKSNNGPTWALGADFLTLQMYFSLSRCPGLAVNYFVYLISESAK